MPLDPLELRKALGQFASGVTVVATVHGGAPHAMTVSSFASVSLDPPLVLFCADRRTRTNAAIEGSRVFAASILAHEQRPLSDLFAGKGTDAERLAALRAAPAAPGTGCPILPGALGWFDCRVAHAYDGGDHVIWVGEVVTAHRGELAPPLLFYRGTYQGLSESWRWVDRYAAKEQVVRFDDMVDFFDRMQREGPFADLLDELAAWGAPAADAVCLDVGCGAGRLARALAARCKEAIGIDESPAMIERARRLTAAAGVPAVFEVARLPSLPFPGGRFDVVTASNLMFLLADPAPALREVARVLRPGGRLLLLDPSTAMTRTSMTEYVRRHGHRGFAAEALLSWAGAAEANRPYDEARQAADLAAAGLEVVAQAHRMDGLVLLCQARRPA